MNSQPELTFLIGLYESNVGDDDPGRLLAFGSRF
jgi:hypothetical protein